MQAAKPTFKVCGLSARHHGHTWPAFNRTARRAPPCAWISYVPAWQLGRQTPEALCWADITRLTTPRPLCHSLCSWVMVVWARRPL